MALCADVRGIWYRLAAAFYIVGRTFSAANLYGIDGVDGYHSSNPTIWQRYRETFEQGVSCLSNIAIRLDTLVIFRAAFTCKSPGLH